MKGRATAARRGCATVLCGRVREATLGVCALFRRRETTAEVRLTRSKVGSVIQMFLWGCVWGPHARLRSEVQRQVGAVGPCAIYLLRDWDPAHGVRVPSQRDRRSPVSGHFPASLASQGQSVSSFPGRPRAGRAALPTRPPAPPPRPASSAGRTSSPHAALPHAAVTASGPNLAPPSAATTRGSSRAPPCGHMPPSAPPQAPCLTLLLVVPSESPRGPLVPPLPPGGATYSQGLRGRCRPSLPAGRTGLRQGDSATAPLRPSDPRPRVSQALRPAADLPRAPEARASPRPPSARRAQSGRPRPCPREQTRGPVRGDASRGESAAGRPARTPNFITRKSLRNALGAWGAGWETAQGER